VFIVGCEDGVFPHSRALDEGALEEERRLFYVGVTRAMRTLYLTRARRRAVFGAQTYGFPSRFLAEVPAELTDREEQEAMAVGSAVGRSSLGGAALHGLPDHAPARAEGWASAGSWASAARVTGDRPPGGRGRPAEGGRSQRAPVADSYRLGEDVTHASFGEGVVTGVEPDGVIVVRFAGDGSERKLLTELTPLTRR
jgi:DNA helicase-2/ATP-dependent DNA helicase PcrA